MQLLRPGNSILTLVLVLEAGCALGPVRQAKVAALGRWQDTHAVAVTAARDTPSAVAPALLASVQQTLQARARLAPAAADDATAFRVELSARELALASSSRTFDELLARATGAAAPTTWLSVEGLLYAPGEREPRGLVRWENVGTPEALAPAAGFALGEALSDRVVARRADFFDRRAADERLFLTPTPNTLEEGSFFVSNDEVLLFRAGVGLGRRVQLDAWLGGFPIPVAGATLLPPVHMVAGVGGAGFGVLGVADLGLKVKVLEETASLPGLSVSYDLLDAFGAAIGGGGGIALGDGLVVAGAPGVAGANVQLNVFALSVGKHFGATHVTAGGWVIDNHHFLPQSAGFAAGVVSNVGAASISDSVSIPRLPTVVQPFVAVEQVLGPHSALAVELLPRWPVEGSFATTGVRWLVGGDAPRGPFALDRIRVRLDLAGLWLYLPPTTRAAGGLVLPVPWLGVGVYVL